MSARICGCPRPDWHLASDHGGDGGGGNFFRGIAFGAFFVAVLWITVIGSVLVVTR